MGLGAASEDAYIVQSAGDPVVCGSASFMALYERGTIQITDESGLSLSVRDTWLMVPAVLLPSAVVRDAVLTVRGVRFRVREVQDPDTNDWQKVVLAEA